MISIGRRQSVLMVAGALLSEGNTAFGQGARSDPLDAAISRSLDLQKIAISASEGKDFLEFVVQSFFMRQSMVAIAADSGKFDNSKTAQYYLNSKIGTTSQGIPDVYFSSDRLESQIQVVLYVSSENVPLVPRVEEVQPIGIPVIEPIDKKNEDTDFEVILDIVLQTMGVFDSKTLVNEILKDKNVQSELQRIAPALKDKDWKKILELGEEFFKLVLAQRFFRAYAEKIGKRIAFGLTLRCVPIAGWIYLAAAFVVALKENYRRFSFA